MPNGLFNLKQQLSGIQQSAWTGQKTPAVNYLVVAGGGGARNSNQPSGGGGAGGLLQGNIPVVAGSAITVTVGAGQVDNGSNSVFGSITATGGGASGQATQPGNAGGSGGGGTATNTLVFGGQGVFGQGNAGGNGAGSPNNAAGGGGGAGTVGLNYSGTIAGNGGAGIASDISGTRTVYAGGGGGGTATGGTAGSGGAGGGGAGGVGSATGTAGTANTGGGAGGSGAGGANQSGGSGIVIISYPDTYAAATSTTGSPTVSTSGSGSISTNGSSQYWYYGGQSAFAFGTGDFTIEGWYYFNDVTTIQIMWDFRANAVNGSNPVLYIGSGLINYYPAGSTAITGTTTISTGSWYHVALARSGTSTKLFVNGVQQGTTYTDSTNYAVGASRPMFNASGFANGGSAFLNGYSSNIRIVKGTAVYTSAFTPPTAPLTAITNTSLMLNTVSGAYFADASTNGFAPTAAASPAWNQLSPFSTGLGYKNRVYTWTSSGSITF
jgi:hypothetical protein